jgi:DNA-binding MarR family transcriptional regulator
MSAQLSPPSLRPRISPSAGLSPQVLLAQARVLAAVVDGAVLRGALAGLAGQFGATVADLTEAILELSASGWVMTQSNPYDQIVVRWERRVAEDGRAGPVERRLRPGIRRPQA